MQQETGADIAVDDDGTVGVVTIGAKLRSAVDEARRRIELILDPPTPEVGAVYSGKVVNITKFGAFVNILPGRDGLVHISRLGQGKRVERVEDVVQLGQEVEVRVDDIDPQGKVSLSLVGGEGGGGASGPAGAAAGSAPSPAQAPSQAPSSSSSSSSSSGNGGSPAPRRASFDDAFDAELQATYGDLGPKGESSEGRGSRPGNGGGARRSEGPRRRPRGGQR
jgi:polyribonucleotide nucleotidyltransferase